jgi:hypothetical protein
MARVERAAAGSTYEIWFEGTLEVEPSAWLNGLSRIEEVRRGDASITCLTLHVADQAALRGVLNRLWDLNLTLAGVRRVGAATDKETDDGS